MPNGPRGQPNRPRMPAMVKREIRETDDAHGEEGDGEDDKRMSYRGFDKGKLNSSRKAARKAKREQKKQGKEEHRRERAMATKNLKKLQEENEELRRQLQAAKGGGAPPVKADGKRKSAEQVGAPPKKQKKGPKAEAVGPQPSDQASAVSKKPSTTQGKENRKAKDMPDSNFMKMIKEQGLHRGQGQDALKQAIEEDKREIEELQKKLGSNWRKGMEEDGWLGFFDSLDALGDDSGEEDMLEEVEGEEDDEDDEDDEQQPARARKVKFDDVMRRTRQPDELEGEDEDEEEDEDDEDDEDEDEEGAGTGDDEDAMGAADEVDDDEDDGEGLEEGEDDEEEVDDEDEDEEDEEDEEDDDEEEEEEEEEELSSTKPAGTAASGGGKDVVQKYVPPHLRAQLEGGDKLTAAVRNNLNKVSEGNIGSIARELHATYSSNPTVEVDRVLGDIVLELAGESSGRIIGQFAALYAALVAAMHVSVGNMVGARFLERLVRQIHLLLESNTSTLASNNYALIVAHLYVFKVIHCSVIYDMVRQLSERFSEQALEMLLSTLKVTGSKLRADDPSALRDIIQLVRSKAAESSQTAQMPPRARYLLDFIYELQNNKHKRGVGAAAVAEEETARLGKWLRTYTAETGKGGTAAQLRPAWDDVVNRKLRGPWWEQGVRLDPVLMTTLAGKRNGTEAKLDGGKEGGDEDLQKLTKLASKQRMGTDVRKAVFVVMMQSEDYMDAVEKLLRLGLKGNEAREIVRVAFHCCVHEKGFNPFYALLLAQLCSIDKNHQFTLRLSMWDALKEVDEWAASGSKSKVGNVASLMAHAWLQGSLSLSLLKPVDIEQLADGGRLCLELALRGLLQKASDETLAGLVGKVASSQREMKELRAGLVWFTNKHVIPNCKSPAGGKAALDVDGEAAFQPSSKQDRIAKQAKLFLDLLRKCSAL